jgi:hypothetical protein
VLIHIPPDDIDAVISELLRVSRGQILHIENNETTQSKRTSNAHDGCWVHDLGACYARHNRSLEVLPRHFRLEDIYRVALDPSIELPDVDPQTARLALDLDENLSLELQEFERRIAELQRELSDVRNRLSSIDGALRSALGL